MFAGTAVVTGVLSSRPIAGGAYDSLAVPLAFGLALALLVAALGQVSRARFNPAATISPAAIRRFPWVYAPVYLGAQFVGATVGALANWLTYGHPGQSKAALGATFPSSGVSDLRALAVEALITFILVTFILVLVIVSVATDERVEAPPLRTWPSALASCVFIGGPITGVR